MSIKSDYVWQLSTFLYGKSMVKSLLLLSVLWALIFPRFCVATTLLIAYEEKDNPPFYYLSGSGLNGSIHKPGVTPEVLNLIAKRLGFDIQYIRYPWARGLMKIELNEIDALFHASFKEERLLNGVYPMKGGKPDPNRMVMMQSYNLYKHKDSSLSWDGEKIEHLSGSIGALLNYAIVGDLKKLGVNVEEASYLLSLLKRVENRRLAGLASLGNMTDVLISKHASVLKNVVKLSPPLKVKPYYLMFSHGFVEENTSLANAIWHEIEVMKKSGEYNAILKSYRD